MNASVGLGWWLAIVAATGDLFLATVGGALAFSYLRIITREKLPR